jgi:spore coat protein U-like protein
MRKLTIMLLFLLLCFGRMGAQQNYCQLNLGSQVAFGHYNSATVQTSMSFNVSCTSGVAYTLALSAGTTSGATTNNRMLYCSNCNPTTLGYRLYSNASYTTNWGNNLNIDTVSRIGSGNSQSYTIYAKIPANEYFFPSSYGGNYTDSVTITLNCPKCTNISNPSQAFNLNVSGVDPGCGISANDLNFGNYTGAELNATTTLQVGCTNGTAYNVGLNAGNNGADVLHRSMTLTGGNVSLNYKLLQGSYSGSNWGNTVKVDTVAGTANGATQFLTVYGVIPAGQSVTQGTYTDTITATITY